MNKVSIIAASKVTAADLAAVPSGQRLGQRFGRLNLQSQLSLLAVESLNLDFNGMARERTGICLATSAGSLSTDVNFWQGRNGTGGPSPTLFAYTLPSAAAGEIAIHFKVTGPNLCFVGDGQIVLPEAFDLIRRGEADSCICVFNEVVSAELAKIISVPPVACAWALCLKRGEGMRELKEFDRDIKALCALISHPKSAV
jgi:3-oxoacyl-(acyl-carrier-protein) synthase